MLDAGAEVIHVDVMDGDFVPPITIGPLIVSAIADQVHAAGARRRLPPDDPSGRRLQVDEFARAGADSITVHAEATPHLDRVVEAIHEAGCRAGVAINPGTPVIALERVAGRLRPAPLHERQPRLGRAVVHRGLAREGRGASPRSAPLR